jgi:hypothetical protein
VLADRALARFISGHSVAAEHHLYAVLLLTSWMRHYRIAT